MSIVDDPSQWTRKPRDIFSDKVKESLDKRGWGEVEGDTPANPEQAQVDDGRQHSIHDYHKLRSNMDDIRTYCRSRARTYERSGNTTEAKVWRDLEKFVDARLKDKPMDGGAF